MPHMGRWVRFLGAMGIVTALAAAVGVPLWWARGRRRRRPR